MEVAILLVLQQGAFCLGTKARAYLANLTYSWPSLGGTMSAGSPVWGLTC